MTAAETWTINEAVSWLDPPITARKLRAAFMIAEIEPAGRRATGHSGPGVCVYDVRETMALHADLAPWLARLARLSTI